MFQESVLLAGLKSGAVEFFDILNDNDEIENSEKDDNNNGKLFLKSASMY